MSANLDRDPFEMDMEEQDLSGRETAQVLVHRTKFSRNRLLRLCNCTVFCCLGSIVLILFLIQLSRPLSNEECDAQLAKVSNDLTRPTGSLCADHSLGEMNLSDVFLLSETDREKTPVVSFLALGDWGRDGHCCQKDVAWEMNRAAELMQAQFIVNTGDSFYPAGVLSVNDPQFSTSFEDVYLSSQYTYLRKMSFWTVLGNHEYAGDIPSFLALSKRNQQFAVNQRRYFSQKFTNKGLTVLIVFLDTSPFIGSYKDASYDNYFRRPEQKESGLSSQQGDALKRQVDFLRDTLRQSRDDEVRIVVGHHPIYDDEKGHVGENRTELQHQVVPLLKAYKVRAYISGHEHFLLYTNRTTAHFVSGAGSKLNGLLQMPNQKEFYKMTQGFLAFQVRREQLAVAAIDYKGNVIAKKVI